MKQLDKIYDPGKAEDRLYKFWNDSGYFAPKKGKKDEIKAFAESRGESLNGFINRAIDEAMQRK